MRRRLRRGKQSLSRNFYSSLNYQREKEEMAKGKEKEEDLHEDVETGSELDLARIDQFN